jgi:hypothetical protein
VKLRARVLVRIAVSAGLLAALFRVVDGDAVLARMRDLDPVWVLVALAVSLPQMALLAFRWRLTAARLGLASGSRCRSEPRSASTTWASSSISCCPAA